MPVTESPLRYPGGKTQITPLVRELLSQNRLGGGVYAEPFAGGAGVAWRLLLNGDVSEVWLNDLDPALYAFWATVIREPEGLCEKIRRTRISMAEWRRQRAVLFDSASNRSELAFATLFLNRTNRSGILKAGVIGGTAQDGNYKLDCRFNKTELISKINRIHSYREVIKLTRHDAETCLKRWNRDLPRRGLINIDPPYYVQGRDLYLSFYRHRDHVRLAELVKSLEVPWMLTYDDVPEIEALYGDRKIHRARLLYYAQVKRRASEIVVFADSLQAPGGLSHERAA